MSRYINRSCILCDVFFFFKQKTAYEMRISDWSSDVCSSDLQLAAVACRRNPVQVGAGDADIAEPAQLESIALNAHVDGFVVAERGDDPDMVGRLDQQTLAFDTRQLESARKKRGTGDIDPIPIASGGV